MALPAVRAAENPQSLNLQPLTLAPSTSTQSMVSGELRKHIEQELLDLDTRVKELVEPKLSITVLVSDNQKSKGVFDTLVSTFTAEYPRFASTQAAMDAFSTTISKSFTEKQYKHVRTPTKEALKKENEAFNKEYYSFKDVANHVNALLQQFQRDLPSLSPITRDLPALPKDKEEAPEPAKYRKEAGALDEIARKRYEIIDDLRGKMKVLNDAMTATLKETGAKVARFNRLAGNDGEPLYTVTRWAFRVLPEWLILPDRVIESSEQAASAEASGESAPKAASASGDKLVEVSGESAPKAASASGDKPAEASGEAAPKAASASGDKPVEGGESSASKSAAASSESSAEAQQEQAGPKEFSQPQNSEPTTAIASSAPASSSAPTVGPTKAVAGASAVLVEPSIHEPKTPTRAASPNDGIGKKPNSVGNAGKTTYAAAASGKKQKKED